jgi:hypothetical protein
VSATHLPTVRALVDEKVNFYKGYLVGFQHALRASSELDEFDLQVKARREMLFYKTLEERANENGWLNKPYDYSEMMQDLWEDWMVKPYPESEAVVEALNECREYNKQRLGENEQLPT